MKTLINRTLTIVLVISAYAGVQASQQATPKNKPLAQLKADNANSPTIKEGHFADWLNENNISLEGTEYDSVDDLYADMLNFGLDDVIDGVVNREAIRQKVIAVIVPKFNNTLDSDKIEEMVRWFATDKIVDLCDEVKALKEAQEKQVVAEQAAQEAVVKQNLMKRLEQLKEENADSPTIKEGGLTGFLKKNAISLAVSDYNTVDDLYADITDFDESIVVNGKISDDTKQATRERIEETILGKFANHPDADSDEFRNIISEMVREFSLNKFSDLAYPKFKQVPPPTKTPQISAQQTYATYAGVLAAIILSAYFLNSYLSKSSSASAKVF